MFFDVGMALMGLVPKENKRCLGVSWRERLLGGGFEKRSCRRKMLCALKKCQPFYKKQRGVLWLIDNFLQLTKFFKRSQAPENNENVLWNMFYIETNGA